ncbi:hypothetical protein C8J57DRAFT_1215951 [Mycena rebaudengoi]|nr:hypothetical protein C8J57DRAFT_1215951 [Mycena rebaudengoi]
MAKNFSIKVLFHILYPSLVIATSLQEKCFKQPVVVKSAMASSASIPVLLQMCRTIHLRIWQPHMDQAQAFQAGHVLQLAKRQCTIGGAYSPALCSSGSGSKAI